MHQNVTYNWRQTRLPKLSCAASTWWCGPRPSYDKWAKMVRQLYWRVWPSGRPQLTKFFSCRNLSETAFKRKGLQTKLFWASLISLKLLIQSGTQLSFTNFWL